MVNGNTASAWGKARSLDSKVALSSKISPPENPRQADLRSSVSSGHEDTSAQQVISLGSSSAGVRDFQAKLKGLGFNIDVDGVFGPQTKAAVQSYQASQGLLVDGIIGPSTAAEISSDHDINEQMVADGRIASAIMAGEDADRLHLVNPTTGREYTDSEIGDIADRVDAYENQQQQIADGRVVREVLAGGDAERMHFINPGTGREYTDAEINDLAKQHQGSTGGGSFTRDALKPSDDQSWMERIKTSPWLDPSTDSIVINNSPLARLVVSGSPLPSKEYYDRLHEHGPSEIEELFQVRQNLEKAIYPIHRVPSILNSDDKFQEFLNQSSQVIQERKELLGGTKDWAVDTGSLALTLAGASNPAFGAAYYSTTGRIANKDLFDGMNELGKSFVSDPDGVVKDTIGYDELKENPLKWIGYNAPELAFEFVSPPGFSKVDDLAEMRRAPNNVPEKKSEIVIDKADSNYIVGQKGEAFYRGQADAFSLQNGSGQGIDSIRYDKDGTLVFGEIKTSKVGNHRLTPEQAAGARSFVEDRLTYMAEGSHPYMAFTEEQRALADSLLRDLLAEPYNVRFEIVELDVLPDGNLAIRDVKKWPAGGNDPFGHDTHWKTISEDLPKTSKDDAITFDPTPSTGSSYPASESLAELDPAMSKGAHTAQQKLEGTALPPTSALSETAAVVADLAKTTLPTNAAVSFARESQSGTIAEETSHDNLHYGSSGADSLDGGPGDNFLFGGEGRDTFIFNTQEEGARTSVGDFDSGWDRIEFENVTRFDGIEISNGTDADSDGDGKITAQDIGWENWNDTGLMFRGEDKFLFIDIIDRDETMLNVWDIA